MEKDVFCAHGTMRALHEKFYNDSDGFELPVCRACGNRAVVNERENIYRCKYCGDNADIVSVPSSWCQNLLYQELSAMNIKTQYVLQPHAYPRHENATDKSPEP